VGPILLVNRLGRRAVMLAAVVLAGVSVAAGTDKQESALRRNLAWQIALDRLGLSPGLIDGRPGGKTRLASAEFQRVRGLPVTGELDEATAAALEIKPDQAIGRYTIQAADLAEIGPVPKTWLAKSKLSHLGHESLDAVIAEKFHCSVDLLRMLNPGRELNALKAGEPVIMPMVAQPVPPERAEWIEVNLAEKVIRAINHHRQLVGLFHCSIAASKTKLPSGQAHVIGVALNPTYTFDPQMWPEVKENITEKLHIPPGPRNPVGRCWIGLSLPGYGIHGTPNPELIGKTGSHGCIRLANWDALRLGQMVEVGTPVHFSDQPDTRIASARW